MPERSTMRFDSDAASAHDAGAAPLPAGRARMIRALHRKKERLAAKQLDRPALSRVHGGDGADLPPADLSYSGEYIHAAPWNHPPPTPPSNP